MYSWTCKPGINDCSQKKKFHDEANDGYLPKKKRIEGIIEIISEFQEGIDPTTNNY